ncbi:MAG TPA: hypothetical protein VGV39_04615 [Mesorhizobium sp.]|uniref:phage tail assembly chaperone n=1 Tax=Mesorhizobium sp. TaxID=1871066 RepID=UPI002DDCDC6E|nr:hypothetical protein [Mesorhizobium sp.]HEV2502331.1 hypothetical protein [Mesorhizobium sp.]
MTIPPLPLSVRYLWSTFHRISNRRPSGYGLSLIPWSEIAAFQQVTRFKLSGWELEIIEALDMELVAAHAA